MKRPKSKAYTVRTLLHQIKLLQLSGDITLDTKLVYSADDEGNEYQAPVFLPGVCYSNQDLDYGGRLDPDEVEIQCERQADRQGKSFTYLCLN